MRMHQSALLAAALVAVAAVNGAAGHEGEDSGRPTIREELDELELRDAEQRRRIEELERKLEATDRSDSAVRAPESDASVTEPSGSSRDWWSAQVGPARLRLMDIALDLVASAGSSSSRNAALENLQGGGHDPRQRGFNLQQLELSFQGSVDPYFQGDAFLVFFLDAEGETRLELEEAFLTTISLPFRLHELGLQIEMGTFFTEFGRVNTQHPHYWRWQDQPVVLTRFFGEDGLRGPGFRVGWLAPLPWFSEIHFGVQNSSGETQVSFLANGEVFDTRPIGGRPFTDREVRSTRDLTYLARWVNGFDVGDAWSTQLGLSTVFGPNATGSRASTHIFGADIVAKWRPLPTDRGWPFVVVQAEIIGRRYETDAFVGPGADGITISLPDDVLKDWGFYVEGVWGFVRRWAAGVRYEHANGGGGPSFAGGVAISKNLDPFRDNRHRVSPLLIFHPSEFSRLRLQYNYDRAPHLRSGHAHSVWFGVEIGLGAHPAHAY